MKLKVPLALAVVTACGSAPALAENCKVTNGVDYRFEHATAVRSVHDDHDQGEIRLASYIYRPLKNRRDAIVLFSHGSTGGFDFDPKEPQPIVQCSLKNYFLTRGITLVAFARRGRGESTGAYVEECDRHSDPSCTPTRTRESSDRAIEEGLADTEAVFDQVVIKQLAGPGSAILLAGHSRGSVLSLALARRHPRQIAAVFNFSGGWLGTQRGDGAERENALRTTYQHALFGKLAQYRGPTLWLYADRDPLYDEATTRRFHSAFLASGGRGDYVQVHAPSLENGHLLFQESSLWSDRADAFLQEMAALSAK